MPDDARPRNHDGVTVPPARGIVRRVAIRAGIVALCLAAIWAGALGTLWLGLGAGPISFQRLLPQIIANIEARLPEGYVLSAAAARLTRTESGGIA
ncbi:MAG: hypothetical protein AAFX39_04355, partial [Pseudomonadota bacterium]